MPCPILWTTSTQSRIIVNTEPEKGLVYLSFVKANEKTNITFGLEICKKEEKINISF